MELFGSLDSYGLCALIFVLCLYTRVTTRVRSYGRVSVSVCLPSCLLVV